MKLSIRFVLFLFLALASYSVLAQHSNVMKIVLNDTLQELTVNQNITYINQTNVSLDTLYFYDWNHAYSDKNSPLAQRFSDEFYIGFHLSKAEDRGYTHILSFRNAISKRAMPLFRKQKQLDIIGLPLEKPLLSGEALQFEIDYLVKLPNEKFTHTGFSEDGFYFLKNCWLLPVAYNNGFKTYSNLNLDDAEVARSDLKVALSVPEKYRVQTDLVETAKQPTGNYVTYNYEAQNKKNFSVWIDAQSIFQKFVGQEIEVRNGLEVTNKNDIQLAFITDRVVKFSKEYLGDFSCHNVLITSADYQRNPVYGLNQLPNFLSPFNPDFVYEIKFLKTYLQVYLNEQLPIDLRKEQWILDGIQIFMMMNYVNRFYPEEKMMGNVGKFKLLKNYNLTQIDFNGQYQYFYELMLRKNLDQGLDLPKDELIKFNGQIANKYKSGLNFRYLDNYLGESILQSSIKEFATQAKDSTKKEFLEIVIEKSNKDLDWFEAHLVETRNIIDFKWDKISESEDSVSYEITEKNNIKIPVTVYRFNNNKVISKEWIAPNDFPKKYKFSKDSVEYVAINYEQIVPEYNKRNNWRSIKKPFNRRFKFSFMKDLENPNYNQLLFSPFITYNLYDGLSPGMRLHNKAILDKPFNFDVTPIYSSNTQSLIGRANLVFNDYRRDSKLFHVRYSLSSSVFHYAPEARYFTINPMVTFRYRENEFRNNHQKILILRNNIIYREASNFTDENTENYSIFNVRYVDSYTEMTRHFSFAPDFQLSNLFGKISGQIQYRKLFDNNRQLNVRWFGGVFLYKNTESDFFDFGLDRPTDYMFDLPLLGRSETSGFFSQQFIMAEGGFKSKFPSRFANQWISTINISTSIWNWVEAYTDFGMIKNHKQSTSPILHDSGIRLNLVTDYFEVYFPVYSSNGWEVGQKNYNERIRFVVTISPKNLVSLFTRKWL